MARRAPTLAFDNLLAAIPLTTPVDRTSLAIIDSTAEVIRHSGLRNTTVEAVAEHGGFGRTTIYRRFDSRDGLIRAVIVHSAIQFLDEVNRAVEYIDELELRVIEGILVGLRLSRSNLLSEVARSDPDLLRMFTVDATPFVDAAVSFLLNALRAYGGRADERSQLVASMLIRWAISAALSDQPVLSDDDIEARQQIRLMIGPLFS